MTSVDLITTSTVSPFFSFISLALYRLITLSIANLPSLTTTWAMMSPNVILLIRPCSLILAERARSQRYTFNRRSR